MRNAFNTFSIRADTDQELLSELPDQGLLCLIIKKKVTIYWIRQVMYWVNVQKRNFIIATTLEKLKGPIEISLSVRQSVKI